ncbi:MAG: hypothetical protein AB1641_03975 [Thermodesulfobacteriota bacterium]
MLSARTPVGQVTLEADGLIIFPEEIMERCILETPGAKLWFNEKDRALGVKLLRGEKSPPYLIERRPGALGGVVGVLRAGPFLAKVGFKTGLAPLRLPCSYFQQYHLLGISLGGEELKKIPEVKGVLDDFPALED